MKRFIMFIMLAAGAASLCLAACGDKKTAAKKAKDVPGACECAIECANEIAVDDTAGLVECKAACQQKFGAGAMVEGMKRAMEVMSSAREGCED